MNENIKITWLKPSKDIQPGQYFVAIKYPSGLGTYEMLIWNGDEWVMDYTGEITGVVYIYNGDWGEDILQQHMELMNNTP